MIVIILNSAAGVNPATPIYGDKPDQNWIDDEFS